VDILRIGHWGIKVEVLEVDGAEARAFAREHTVEEHLEEFERCGVCANIPWETDATATNGDAGTIRIVFFRTNFANLPWCGRFPFVCGREYRDSR
jgi:hypothetical protein